MCGILALVRGAGAPAATTHPIVAATHTVRHRGPDDEGYLLWDGAASRVYGGPDTARSSREARRLAPLPEHASWRVGLGHRRLSILDLTPAGHQPMVHRGTGLALVFNGEIYNHVELRRELEARGHRFESDHSDTEVLLVAWVEWGPSCLDRLNGMFAFVLLDPRGGGTLHAVRDRFGVKPLYWARVGDLLAFGSEVKALRALPGYALRLNEVVAADFLATGLLDHSRHTFDAGVQQLLGGERAVVRLDAASPLPEVTRWYRLEPRPVASSPSEAAVALRELLADSVRLRLRADVPVGSCLSGGLDSSAIVCLARRELESRGDHAGQVTVTARFEDGRFDEWRFAREVANAAGARAVAVWPSLDRLQRELDRLLWHMDEPFGSTSMFSQWCVFSGAADAGVTVMLDGQGSDEQLAGYGGSDAALYAGLLRRGALASLAGEAVAARQRSGRLPLAPLVLALRNVLPALDALLPARVRVAASRPDWLRGGIASLAEGAPPRDLAEHLRRQVVTTSLPALLHYEDRNSMAWSIEARVPFLDYRLVEFTAALPDSLKTSRGMTKVVLREAMRGLLPESVRDRRDKMGFVTPEQLWLTHSASDWFRAGTRAAAEAAPGLLDADRVLRMADDTIEGRTPFTFAPWRILCLGRWLQVAGSGTAPAVPPAEVGVA